MQDITNYAKIVIPAYSKNEGLARMFVSSFASQLDPTIEEINDIKAAVSEAVTNSIVHGYCNKIGDITILLRILGSDTLYIKISDKGIGIPDIKKAMEPLFTTSPEGERAGLGFAVMESFTDKIRVTSKVGKGTSVTLLKRLNGRHEQTD